MIKTKLSLALRLLYASACIRLVHVAVFPGGHFLTVLEWITGPRYSRQCVSGTAPLWKVPHRFCSSSVGSAEGTTVVLYCSVSPCCLIWGTLITFWSRPSTEVLKAISELIRRSANNPKTHGKPACYIVARLDAANRQMTSQSYYTTASLSFEIPLRTY